MANTTYTGDVGKKLKERLDAVNAFYAKSRRMPTYSEMASLFGVKSKNAVFKTVNKFIKSGLLNKDGKGFLLPLMALQPAIPVKDNHFLRLLGSVEAGFPSPAEEELLDSVSIDKLLIKNPNSSFMLEVSGDSMILAGIMPKDFVIVDKSLTPKEGDIVIAQVDGAWTIKYLRKKNGGYLLEPANPEYKTIKPERELTVAGVVVGTVRKYR